jgi:hypothetical protein
MKDQNELNTELNDRDEVTPTLNDAEYLEAEQPEDYDDFDDHDYDHDDMFDTDSGMGSAGMGTDEYYE